MNGFRSKSLPAWFPKRRGRAANRRIRIKIDYNSDCRKHDVDGESVRRNSLRRISLPPTFRSVIMNDNSLEQARREAEKIFRALLPQKGLAVREEQISLCHAMLGRPVPK